MTADTTAPVGSLQEVLAALADPVRLEVVRRLSGADVPIACRLLYDGISKSTASHHFKVLREAGVIETRVVDGHTVQRLRAEDLDAAFPGLLTSVVSAAAG
ncbi:ArsR/SmtB family transcription factor [Nocardioides terrisoli]|uniref:ArsR/SmtB family transcription factor n=1 Tax=Nocardioides terrisoli TaxID=3388267 RepID=UPI00287BC24C|nr:helix-turn-helix domain-containing protein [Nocardioides marmorisolisilvae]